MKIMEIIAKSTIETVEGLTGQTPKCEFRENVELELEKLKSVAIIEIAVSGALDTKLQAVIPVNLATGLTDLMMGGNGKANNEFEENDLEYTKTIFSNIFEATSTALLGQKNKLEINFSVEKIQVAENQDQVEKTVQEPEAKAFWFSLGELKGYFWIYAEKEFWEMGVSEGEKQEENVGKDNHVEENKAWLKEIKLTLSVKLGSTFVTLEELLSLTENREVELDQAENDLVVIYLNNLPIAKAEIVDVNGAYGVQVVEILNKEALEALPGGLGWVQKESRLK